MVEQEKEFNTFEEAKDCAKGLRLMQFDAMILAPAKDMPNNGKYLVVWDDDKWLEEMP